MTRDELQAHLQEIGARFDADPDAFWEKTLDLREADFALMGKVIQLYCYSDLNARRIIDALCHARLGPGARNGSVLQDAQVFPKLREIATELLESNLKEGLIKAADTIKMHQAHRHHFAHWAVRRVGEEDALILLSKNAREAQRRDGMAQTPDQIKYGILPIVEFRCEVAKLEGHATFLAQAAQYVEKHFAQFQQQFAEQANRHRT